MNVNLDGPLSILDDENTKWRRSIERRENGDGGHWDPYDVNEHEDCDEPLLMSDLLFATRLGMTKMIDILIPLTVNISKNTRLQHELHEAIMEINYKVACQWAAVAFKKQF